jgi:hypothetical protein
MKHLILGIILTGCGESFAPQLFTQEIDSPITDGGSTENAESGLIDGPSIGIDSNQPDVDRITDSNDAGNPVVLCCRREDNPECSQCAEFSNSGECTLEGLRCIFHGSGFVDYQICQNGRWQWGEPFSCR